MVRLPAFSSLLAFDAVARHKTFSRAAIELNVTQPAVSRRIQALEMDLGCALFDRRTKPLKLTQAGDELHWVLRTGLSRLEGIVERIRDSRLAESVTISAGGGLAAYWLTPRLAAMQAAFPQLVLRIVTQSHTATDDESGDLQLRFGDGHWPHLSVSKLFGEKVFPVCSPLYLVKQSKPLDSRQISSARLLEMKVSRQPWFDWRDWLQMAGAAPQKTYDRVLFDSYPLVVSAALAGQGICLAWEGLLDEFLKTGALVQVSTLMAESERGYFVTHATDLPADSAIRSVAEWLKEDRLSSHAMFNRIG